MCPNFTKICLFVICLFHNIYAVQKDALQTERKNEIVACANTHLESCEMLLKQGVPEVKTCDVRTECEFVGWLYIQVQNYTQSLPYLKKACDNNNRDGCDNLGFSYQRLNNYKKAKQYYKIACDKGSMSGCYNLAMLYYDGLGVRHSYEMANTLFKRICDMGEGLACLQLGVSYVKGYGVIQNYESGITYFQKGCDLGNNEACNFLDRYKKLQASDDSTNDNKN